MSCNVCNIAHCDGAHMKITKIQEDEGIAKKEHEAKLVTHFDLQCRHFLYFLKTHGVRAINENQIIYTKRGQEITSHMNKEFGGWLAYTYYQETGLIVTPEMRESAMSIIVGEAMAKPDYEKPEKDKSLAGKVSDLINRF